MYKPWFPSGTSCKYNWTSPSPANAKLNICLDFQIPHSAQKCLFSHNKKTHRHTQLEFKFKKTANVPENLIKFSQSASKCVLQF